jgi:hypothetical protein
VDEAIWPDRYQVVIGDLLSKRVILLSKQNRQFVLRDYCGVLLANLQCRYYAAVALRKPVAIEVCNTSLEKRVRGDCTCTQKLCVIKGLMDVPLDTSALYPDATLMI